MTIDDWREYCENRTLIEKLGFLVYPDADIQWMDDRCGLSIDASACPWNPIDHTEVALTIAKKLNLNQYVELFDHLIEDENSYNLRKSFVKEIVQNI